MVFVNREKDNEWLDYSEWEWNRESKFMKKLKKKMMGFVD